MIEPCNKYVVANDNHDLDPEETITIEQFIAKWGRP